MKGFFENSDGAMVPDEETIQSGVIATRTTWTPEERLNRVQGPRQTDKLVCSEYTAMKAASIKPTPRLGWHTVGNGSYRKARKSDKQ